MKLKKTKAKMRFKYKTQLLVAILLLLFPFLVYLLCKIPIKIISLKASELLQFYGISLGIFGSFISYYAEKRKGEIEHDNKLKPYISVELKAKDDGYFDITLTNLKRAILIYIFLYDITLDSTLPSTKKYNVNFYPDNEKCGAIDLSGYDSGLIDFDGYPKYILLSCNDEENRMWQGEYIKLSSGNNVVYQLKEMYLV